MEEPAPETLDLSDKKLKKLNKPSPQQTQVTALILDDNELQRLDNIDSFTKLQKLSAVRNQLLRMYGVCRLHSLHTLNLAHNGILTIEGLKELVHLKHLCLAGNNIKTIEHLNTNVNLEHLDLSENSITHISDLSFLKNLKELLLHNNKISHLRTCDRYLPSSLLALTLANNNIGDLNEISQLVHLTNLTSISLANNPCVCFSAGSSIGFDYRPFVINWCLNVRNIDGYPVDAIESLRAEWLYSQGRGRHFRVGDQHELTQYLATVCPLSGEAYETEEDKKLRIILSKAQHHQQQLREQSNAGTPNPSPVTRKKLHSARNSPRLNSSRLSNRSKSPDRMSSSCYATSNFSDSSNLMSQSLDPSMLLSQSVRSQEGFNVSNGGFIERCLDETEPINSPLQALSKLVPVPESLMSPDYRPSPLVGRINTPSTIPTPVALGKTPTVARVVQSVQQQQRSPKFNRAVAAKNKNNIANEAKRGVNNSPTPPRQRRVFGTANNKESPKKPPPSSILRKSPSTDDEEESEVCDAKLQTIQLKLEEHRQQQNTPPKNPNEDIERAEKAAICIQKLWRGYYTRNKDRNVQEIYRTVQTQRADEYIKKLSDDMESTKAVVESERKIQMLQMQAINALWKKVSALQPRPPSSDCGGDAGVSLGQLGAAGDNAEIVRELARTCTVLQTQIQQLQNSMQDIIKFMTIFSQSTPMAQHLKEHGIATQTDISAVHTPQGENAKNFPFIKQTRPSSLPLPVVRQSKKDDKTVNPELKQYAGSLVDDVIKTVSEAKPEELCANMSVSDDENQPVKNQPVQTEEN